MSKLYPYLLIILLFQSAHCDCGYTDSFVNTAFKADLVAMVTIQDTYHHGYILKIIEVWRKKDDLNYDFILAWSSSECELDRDQINGSEGDTLLVALYQKTRQDTCTTKYLSFIEKMGENVYQTQTCGTNVLKYNKGHFIGQITKKAGILIEVKTSSFFPYEEEKMPYKLLLDILAVIK